MTRPARARTAACSTPAFRPRSNRTELESAHRRRGHRSQLGPAGVVGRGSPGGGRAERTAGAGERGQSVAVRCRAVPSQQLVEAHARRQVFQDEETGGCISGDDTGSEAGPEVLAEELKRGQLGTQPPRSSTGVP
ncbi:hypothetical protein [Streptomyces rhizosphaericus]|uniref:hypothetical protein n=1 Tax=Streptomyces rhizosphaericus TaxID=114699 RepID=UPI0011801BA9|nr:hypothetical protein [Streptomyces rhizosphaericus]